MAQISEFQWQGGIVLECKKCPTTFQFGAGDPEELEEVIKNVVNHKHVIEGGGSTVNQSAVAHGSARIVQGGRDVFFTNDTSSRVTGHVGDVNPYQPRRRRETLGSRTAGYLW